MSSPVVEKDAGVEALFWRVAVHDEIRGQDLERSLRHYIRLKVFNEKGKEKTATVDIDQPDKVIISDIVGRTIKPDGTIVELTRDAVHERQVLRVGRRKVRVKSFAMPAVEPGAIVEYRWREVRSGDSMSYLRLEMQREFPVQHVIYQIKPLPQNIIPFKMSLMAFNCNLAPPVPDRDDYNVVTLDNVSAYREEPMMPSAPNVRPWALGIYHDDARQDPAKYWNEIGKKRYSALKSALRLDDRLKADARQAVEGAASDEDKTLALIRYIRKNVRSLWDRRVSDEDRREVLKHMPKDRERTSVEVYRSGLGTADELNTLFAAMASAVGLEARPAFVASRNEVKFSPVMSDGYFLRNLDMAVQIDGKWKIYDVSTRRLPPALLSWPEEGVQALVASPKNPEFVETGNPLPEASSTMRTGKFELSANGTLEGEIELTYTGHSAEEHRSDYEDQTEARQQEMIKERVTQVFSQAEVSGIRLKNFDDPEQPFSVQYHIKLPQYAQRTGKRLLLQPLYFQRGEAPLFQSTERHYDISFPYPWREVDDIRIHYPKEFVLDNAENPGPLEFGPAGYYHLSMKSSTESELFCQRELVFGRKGALIYPLSSYSRVKNAFDLIHGRDEVSIALKLAPPVQAGK